MTEIQEQFVAPPRGSSTRSVRNSEDPWELAKIQSCESESSRENKEEENLAELLKHAGLEEFEDKIVAEDFDAQSLRRLSK